MEEGFHAQHTITTSSNVRTGTDNPTIRFDISYIRTLPGLLKGVQMVLELLGFLCVIVVEYDVVYTRYFNTIVMTGFSFSAVFLCLYLFHVVGKYRKIPWIEIEFVCCVILTLSNILSASLIAALAKHFASFGAAAFFGFSAMVAYGADAWLKFLAVKSGDIAQLG